MQEWSREFVEPHITRLARVVCQQLAVVCQYEWQSGRRWLVGDIGPVRQLISPGCRDKAKGVLPVL